MFDLFFLSNEFLEIFYFEVYFHERYVKLKKLPNYANPGWEVYKLYSLVESQQH